MQNFKNDVTQPVIFNTPKSLNLSELFPTYTQDKLDKVSYIVHQCNYYTNKNGYNLDLTNHRWFLSLTRNDLSFIKKVLIEASVIKQTIKGTKGNKSDHFSMVKPFNYLNESTVNKHFFYLNDSACPLWVQRYVADGSAVKNAKTTNWVKRPNDWQPDSLLQPATAVEPDNRDAYIQLLELALITNNIPLPVMNTTPAPEVKISDSTPIKEEEPKAGLIMAEGHSKPFEVKPPVAVTSVKPELSTPVTKVEKAKNVLAGLRVKQVTPVAIVAEPEKVNVLNTDVHSMGDYIMVNYKRYTRATQLSGFMDKVKIERRLSELVANGYQGSEVFNTETWKLTFDIDSASGKVTLSSVLDTEIAA
ncbi:hypothetical protein [Mucilaginibacter sp.]|uniref:hypothetical protein n=1 Tax=Mucilaginibacter sp. TaxID=1882438 RepID=UPI003D0EE2DA